MRTDGDVAHEAVLKIGDPVRFTDDTLNACRFDGRFALFAEHGGVVVGIEHAQDIQRLPSCTMLVRAYGCLELIRCPAVLLRLDLQAALGDALWAR